jgi:hypothetical protein
MRPILVVVPDEFRQYRPQVLLVEHDDVVQTLAQRSRHGSWPHFSRTISWKSGNVPVKGCRAAKPRAV